MSPLKNGLRVATAALLGCALLASCASGGNDDNTGSGGNGPSGAGTTVGFVGDQSDAGTPTSDGVLRFAGFSPVMSLDPTVTFPTGSTGASELIAIYDVLVRWDYESNTYEPQLAQAITASDDLKTWTLTLRDNVTFSDGTPVNSAAVAWSIDRYVGKGGLSAQQFVESVEKTETPDAKTVVFTLTEPYAQFWSMLALGPGIIVAPSSVDGDKFTPIGAGPFLVDKFSAPESLSLKPRQDYWGGAPKLSELRFVSILGDQPKVDALASGDIDVAYLRDPEVVTEVRDGGATGFQEMQSLGSIGSINASPGRPGADVRVRQAMAYAIDPAAIDDRVNNGTGIPGSEVFMPWSTWHGKVAPIAVDQAKATALLNEAKADGYNGKLLFASPSDTASRAQALSVQSQLQAVGFEVEIVYSTDTTDHTRRMYVDKDYDISRNAFSVAEQDPYSRLFSNLASTSSSNATGFKDPEVDALLQKVKIAPTDDERRDALDELQTALNETVPYLGWASQATLIAWDAKVHGAKPSLDTIVLFDKAWVG